MGLRESLKLICLVGMNSLVEILVIVFTDVIRTFCHNETCFNFVYSDTVLIISYVDVLNADVTLIFYDLGISLQICFLSKFFVDPTHNLN